MALTVSINHPAFPEGTEFGIDYVGVVPNGGSLEVPEENEQKFASAKGMKIEDALTGSEIVSVSGTSNADVVVPEAASEEQGQTTESQTTDSGQETPSNEPNSGETPDEGQVS